MVPEPDNKSSQAGKPDLRDAWRASPAALYSRLFRRLFFRIRAQAIMETRPEGTPGDASRPSSISSTFLEQLRARRPEAWQRLVDLYGPVTYRWCRRSNLTAEDAADVVQEVLAAVMVHLPDFRRERREDSFSGWLAAITRNKVREHYRRRQGKAEPRGGSTAQRQMAEIPQPPEPVGGEHPARRPVGGLPLAAGAGDDPCGVRDPHLGGVLAGQCGRGVARSRRLRPWDQRRGGLHGEIPGLPPFSTGVGRFA